MRVMSRRTLQLGAGLAALAFAVAACSNNKSSTASSGLKTVNGIPNQIVNINGGTPNQGAR